MRSINCFLSLIALLCIQQPCFSAENNPIQSNIPTVNEHFGVDLFDFLEGQWISKTPAQIISETWEKAGRSITGEKMILDGNAKLLDYKISINESKTAPILTLETKTNKPVKGNVVSYTAKSVKMTFESPEGLTQLAYVLIAPKRLSVHIRYEKDGSEISDQTLEFEKK